MLSHPDVTRVLVLDSTQNAVVAETVANLLKDLAQEQAKTMFPVSPCGLVDPIQ